MNTYRLMACCTLLALAGLALLPIVKAQDADKVITNSIDMKLALIPAGKFIMGSPATEAERDPEELQHEVAITKPFYMGVYEVTREQYLKVMGKDPAFFKTNKPDFPMDQVSWNGATEFCRRLSTNADEKKAGRTYRLPTEAEWEYACRGGTKTTFHFGDTLQAKQANFDGKFPFGAVDKGPSHQKPVQVGSYAPNAWGLYDMHGNVSEWCSDWYDPDYYKKSPKDDPKGPENGVISTGFGKDHFHVLRGGSWLDEGRGCRAAYRFRLQSTEAYREIGFRVVCEVKR